MNWSASGYVPFQRRRSSALRSCSALNAVSAAANTEGGTATVAPAIESSPILRLGPKDLAPKQGAALARLQHTLKGRMARRRFVAELRARELRREEGRHINESLQALTQLLEAMQLPPVSVGAVGSRD